MTKIKDIITYFESFAPICTQMDFDNSGLLVGDENKSIKKVLLALDITEAVVLEAERLGCELIISHHPVIFNPIKKLGVHDVPYLLVSKGICALCMHTNLDLGTEFGVNVALSEAVGVTNVLLSEKGECLFVGNLKNETNIEEFCKIVKSSLGCEGLRYTDVKKFVKKIAVSSGAGGSNVFAAAEIGADVLLTGEIRHHEINAANSLGIDIIDAGHYKTEDIVILPLMKKLSEKFSNVAFEKSKEYTDKIKYL